MKRWIRIAAAGVALLLIAAAAVLLVLRSGWFREKLRQRVAAELRQATGGQVDIGRIDFDWKRGRGRLEEIVVHGSEGPGEPPLLRCQAIEVDLKIVSLLSRRVNLAALRVVAPEVHLRIAPDGSTNIPASRLTAEDLVNLAVGRLTIERGAVWWNDRRHEVEAAASNLRAQVHRERGGAYAADVQAGRSIVSSPARVPAIERASTKLRILQDRIEISDLSARTLASELRASGSVAHLAQPQWQFNYDTKGDLREIARALAIPEIRSGRFELRGSFESAGREWKAGGRVSAQQVDASTRDFRLSKASAAGDYTANSREVRLEKLDARLLGGQWTGRLTARPAGHAAAVSLEGRLQGVRLEEVLKALILDGTRPLQGLNWSALVSGPLEIETEAPYSPRKFRAQGDLALEAAEPAAGLTPVSGVVRAAYDYRTGEIRVSEARLATTHTAVSAYGSVDRSGRSNLQFRLQTERLDELLRPAAVLSGTKIEAPIKLSGKAVLQGRISGSLEQPSVDGTVDISSFAYEGRDWDSFAGRVQWSPPRLRVTSGRLIKDKTAINGSVAVTLDRGKFTEESPFEADVSVRDTQVQDLAALAGRSVPLTGAVTASVRAAGTQKAPHGAGRLEVRRGTAWSESFDFFRSAVALDADEVRFSGTQIGKGGNVVSGAASYNPKRDNFRIDARGSNVALAALQFIAASGTTVAGAGTFDVTASGRLAADNSKLLELAVDGSARVRKLAVDGVALGNLTAGARTQGRNIVVEIQSTLAEGEFKGQAEVSAADPFPFVGRGEFRAGDAASLLRGAGVAVGPARVSAEGRVELRGEVLRPHSLAGAGELTRLEVQWNARKPSEAAPPTTWALRNTEPVKWSVTSSRLSLESLHLTGEGTDLRGSGWADLGRKGDVNLRAEGSLNLATLGMLAAGVEAGGSSTLSAAITGSRSEPQINGSLEIRGASVGSENWPVTLSKGNGVVRFSGQSATIQKFTAEAGGGDISVSGDARFAGGPLTYRVRAEAHQVRLRYARGLSVVLEGGLLLTGAEQQSVVAGEIRVARAGTRATMDLGALLGTLKEPARTPGKNEWLQRMQLNVNIVSAPDIQFETALARNFRADANLHLQGNALNPALLGRINIVQGEFEFQGTRYTINRGDITFSNPFRVEPILNLDLETRVSAYDISLTLAGPLDKRLNVSYRSDPPLPFNEVVTLLAVGRAPTTDPTLAAQQSAQARSLGQLEASTLVGQAISKPASSRLQRFFGVSRLKLDPELTGPEGNPNARVTLEQQVGRDITFTYVYNLASAQQQIVRVQWAISKQLSLIAVRDQNGVFGVDFLYKKRYR